MEYIKTYCPNCDKETLHAVYTEDGYGVFRLARIFTAIISVGTSNLDCHTYSKCLSCGDEYEI